MSPDGKYTHQLRKCYWQLCT